MARCGRARLPDPAANHDSTAFDDRHAPSVDAKTGGLVQAASYISGLSGGSETTLALALSDFATSQALLAGGNLYSSSDINETLFGELISKESGAPTFSSAGVEY